MGVHTEVSMGTVDEVGIGGSMMLNLGPTGRLSAGNSGSCTGDGCAINDSLVFAGMV